MAYPRIGTTIRGGASAIALLAALAPIAAPAGPVFRGSGQEAVESPGTGGSDTGGTGTGGGGSTAPQQKALAVSGSPAARSQYKTNSPLSATYLFSGGTAPYAATVSQLPSGVTSSVQSDRVVLSGAPDTVGSYPAITITVTDAAGTVASASTPAITVADVVAAALTIRADPEYPTRSYVGNNDMQADYEVKDAYGNPVFDATFSFSPDIAGSNERFNYGNLVTSFVPATAGTIPARTLTVTTPDGAVGTLTSPAITVDPVNDDPVMSFHAQAPGNVLPAGQDASYQIDISGGTEPYKVSYDQLAHGMTMGPLSTYGHQSGGGGDASDYENFVVSGTPDQSPNAPTTFTVTDAVGKTATLLVQASTLGDPSQVLSLTTQPDLNPNYVLHHSVGVDQNGVETLYDAATNHAEIKVSGGTPPYAATVSPQGDDVDFSTTGLQYSYLESVDLNVTVRKPGPVPSYTITVTDSAGGSTSYTSAPGNAVDRPSDPLSIQAYTDIPSVVYAGADGDTPTVTATYYANGGLPHPYRNGGPDSYAYTVDNLPPGMTATPGGGGLTISGVPTLYGANPAVTIHATDAAGTTASYTTNPFTVQTAPLNIEVYNDFQTEITAGQQAGARLIAQGGRPPYTITAQGPFWEGLDTDASQPGELDFFGVPKQGQVPSYTVTATDSTGATTTVSTSAFTVDPSQPYTPQQQNNGPSTASDPSASGAYTLSALSGPDTVNFTNGSATGTFTTQVSGDVSNAPTWGADSSNYSGATSSDSGTISADGPLSATFTFTGPGDYAVEITATDPSSGGGGAPSPFGPGGFNFPPPPSGPTATSGYKVVHVVEPDNGPIVAVANPPHIVSQPPQKGGSPQQCFADGAFFTGGKGPFTYKVTSTRGSVTIDPSTSPSSGFCVATTGAGGTQETGNGGGIGGDDITITATDSEGRTADNHTTSDPGYDALTGPAVVAGYPGFMHTGQSFFTGVGITGGKRPYTNVTLSVSGDTQGIVYSLSSDGLTMTADSSAWTDDTQLQPAGYGVACTASGTDGDNKPFSVPGACAYVVVK